MKSPLLILCIIISAISFSQSVEKSYPPTTATGFIVKYEDPINGDIHRETTSLKINKDVFLRFQRFNDFYWGKYTIQNVDEKSKIEKGEIIIFTLENGNIIESPSTGLFVPIKERIGEEVFYKLIIKTEIKSNQIDEMMLSPIVNVQIDGKNYPVNPKKWIKKGLKMCQRVKFKK